MANSVQAAINAALNQKWDEAIEINKQILKNNKDDLDTLSRLAYAYTQTGNLERAKRTYKKILNLDKFNSLALKNLHKISGLPENKTTTAMRERVPPGLFIEEPGKTKVVLLKNLAPAKVISTLNIGDTVIISPKKHSIEIRGSDKTYYGALPDDIAFRMLKFINAGNTYMACVKNIQKNSVSVFIREIKRGKKLAHQATFSAIPLKEYTASIQKQIKKAVVVNNDSPISKDSEE